MHEGCNGSERRRLRSRQCWHPRAVAVEMKVRVGGGGMSKLGMAVVESVARSCCMWRSSDSGVAVGDNEDDDGRRQRGPKLGSDTTF